MIALRLFRGFLSRPVQGLKRVYITIRISVGKHMDRLHAPLGILLGTAQSPCRHPDCSIWFSSWHRAVEPCPESREWWTRKNWAAMARNLLLILCASLLIRHTSSQNAATGEWVGHFSPGSTTAGVGEPNQDFFLFQQWLLICQKVSVWCTI